MKVKYILMVSALILFTLNSCKVDRQGELPYFSQLVNVKNGAKVFVIPGSGCSGCISDIESLAIRNQNSDSLFFIFTRLNSMKLFANRFGKSFCESGNVLIDSHNIIKAGSMELEIYPALYTKKDGRFVFEKHIKPLNSIRK